MKQQKNVQNEKCNLLTWGEREREKGREKERECKYFLYQNIALHFALWFRWLNHDEAHHWGI